MKKKLFEEFLESVKQGGSIMRGATKPSRTFEFPESEVRKIREHYGLSQEKFASLIGISVATLRNWEQGRRAPRGGTSRQLQILEHPELVTQLRRSGRRGVKRARQRVASARAVSIATATEPVERGTRKRRRPESV